MAHDPHHTPAHIPEATAAHPADAPDAPAGYHGQHGGVPEVPEGAYDPWADHTGEPPPSDPHGASASPKALALTLIAMTFGVLFVIVSLVVYFNSYTAQLKSQRQEGYTRTSAEYRRLRSDAESQLNVARPEWVAGAEGLVRIPLARAKQRVLEQYQARGDAVHPLEAAPRPAGEPVPAIDAEGGI